MPAINKKDDLGALLAEKLKEHEKLLKENEAKLAYHQKEVDFHRERVEYVKGVLEGLPPAQDKMHLSTLALTEEEKMTKTWYWVKIVKDSLSVLQGKEFKRADVLRLEVLPNPGDKDYKLKVGYAATLALRELVNDGILSAREADGVKGNLYKVKKAS